MKDVVIGFGMEVEIVLMDVVNFVDVFVVGFDDIVVVVNGVGGVVCDVGIVVGEGVGCVLIGW